MNVTMSFNAIKTRLRGNKMKERTDDKTIKQLHILKDVRMFIKRAVKRTRSCQNNLNWKFKL